MESSKEETAFPVIQWSDQGSGMPTVDARDLHEALKVKRDYTTWIKDRLKKSRFVEGEDYVGLSISSNSFPPATGENENLSKDNKEVKKQGRPLSRILISLDVAKALAMKEDNAVGDQVRRYFIEAEKGYQKQLSQPAPSPITRISMEFIEALESHLAAVKEVKRLELSLDEEREKKRKAVEAAKELGEQAEHFEKEAEELRPDAEAFRDLVRSSGGEYSIAASAQTINIPHLGQNNMFKALVGMGYLVRSQTARGRNSYRPTQVMLEMGNMTYHIDKDLIKDGSGNETLVEKHNCYITLKGMSYIRDRLIKRMLMDGTFYAKCGIRSPQPNMQQNPVEQMASRA